MKKKLSRYMSMTLAAALVVNIIAIAFPIIASANSTTKTPVISLAPFSVGGIGDVTANTIHNNNLFVETDYAQVSANRQLLGTLAKLPEKQTNNGTSLKVTTMVGGNPLTYNNATVSHDFIATVSDINEKGLKIDTATNSEYTANNTLSSEAYANIQFTKRNSFVNAEGIMFYLKLDATNTVAPNFSAFMPDSSGRWSAIYNPPIMLKMGCEYSYKSLSDTSWTTTTAVRDVEGNDFFGAMKFNDAFEGYVKVPFSSLGNDSGFVFDPNQDSFSHMCIRAIGIGGKYGTMTAGPFFVVNSDNTSENIEFNNEFVEGPANIGAKINGFKLPLKDADALLVYVKTASANRVGVAANLWDDYLGDVPSIVLKENAAVYTAASGATGWSYQKTVSTPTYGAVEFDDAFEGYIKIPISSFEREIAGTPDTFVYPEIEHLTGVEVTFAGIGGDYGEVSTVPFLINEDKKTTSFESVDAPQEVKYKETIVDPIPTDRSKLYISEANVIHTPITSPVGLTIENGNKMSINIGSNPSGVIDAVDPGVSPAFSIFELADPAINDYEGLVFYVKLTSGNYISPQITVVNRDNWENVSVMLMNGGVYQYMPITGGEWKNGTAVKGLTGSDYFGCVKFDNAFEGYVKIPFSSLYNDNGFVLNTEVDKFDNVNYRFKGLGGDYGDVIIGPNFFVISDGNNGIALTDPEPTTTDPYERIQAIFERSRKGIAQGHYFMVGDSTRHLHNYPIFRLVRNALKENYNMNCVVHAMSGLKAEHWSNYTTNMPDQTAEPTIDKLLPQIPGTGKNCIVDIALGINDSGNTPENMYKFFKKAIDRIREEKPDAVIVYTSPTLIEYESNNERMKTAAEMVWADESIYKIDVLNNVFAGYYPQYYEDTHHPNAEGYKVVADYIISKYLGGPEFEKITDPDKNNLNPIVATPLVDYTIGAPYGNVTAQSVMPDATKNFTTAQGMKLTSATGAEQESTAGTSGNILVAANYDETNPYIMPQDFATKGSFIIYVKTNIANEMYLSFRTDSNQPYFTTGELIENSPYEYLANGGTEWISANASGKIIKFNGEFDGYIKIPVESIVSMDDHAGYVMTYNKLSQVAAWFKNIGGAYGDIITGPFFVTTSDSASTKITVPTDYQPAPLDIKTFGLSDVHSFKGNFSAEKTTGTNNYKLSVASGYVEGDTAIIGAQAETLLVMKPTVKAYMKDAKGIVFYVDFKQPNMFAPSLVLDNDVALMLKPNEKVYVMPETGAAEWVEKGVEAGFVNGGVENTLIYGKLTFDSAFTGYIKVPLSALKSDWYTYSFSGNKIDAVKEVDLRFKGIGGDYGDVVAGIAGYYTEDTPKPEIGIISLPNYPINDLNFDWKFDANDLSDIRSTLLGKGTFTGREVTIVDLFVAKKAYKNLEVENGK